MLPTQGYAAKNATSKLKPFSFERRKPGARDVLIEIHYCGICHSDIHQARNEWDQSTFPMVPGHEIAGRVVRVGARVKRFKAGDPVGVGCFVDSCRKCGPCKAGEEQYCEKHVSWTYNGTEQDQKTATFGGYSNQIVVDEKYVMKIPRSIPLAQAAPLLCAGITTWSPLRHFGVKKGSRVAVVGLGGLGHMGVKLAASLGAEVTVLSTSKSKAKDARRFGARHFVIARTDKDLEKLANRFDFILDTASAVHNLEAYLGMLRRDGVMCLVGVPEEKAHLGPAPLIFKRRRLAGSLIGGTVETQEMLDYCAKKKIYPDIELIPIQKVNAAYEGTIKGKVRYRYVIDLKTL